VALQEGPGEDYVIGPIGRADRLRLAQPELGARVQVRPDGRITTPLIADMPAHGQDARRGAGHPAQAGQYIQDPLVSVIVNLCGHLFRTDPHVAPPGAPPRSPRANMTISDDDCGGRHE
jgi:polysaccharide export outer membrane protein